MTSSRIDRRVTTNQRDEVIGTRDAARILNLTEARVRKMDAQLAPVVVAGRRTFSRSRVEALAGAREAARSLKEKKR